MEAAALVLYVCQGPSALVLYVCQGPPALVLYVCQGPSACRAGARGELVSVSNPDL